MFVYQDGKLFIQKGKKIIGVEVYADKIKTITGTETDEKPNRIILTASEMKAKFNITEETPYIFPQEKKEEKEEVIDDATPKVKKSTGKSKRK